MRVGIGYDVHPFSNNRNLVIGGENLDYKYGLAGHSDADVLVHAIIDSLLGAANLGDIGILFPDNDKKYKDIKSIELLKHVNKILVTNSISIINIDSTLICEEPKIATYVDKMKENISAALNDLATDRIGIKGKTSEKLGFIGRGEGIAAYAVSLICLGV
ncbi:MAG: 2-C-methyl-D-erythritol 2,4-cyclodiphosphate synthase [Spirochaetota bacterium]|nr:2-C-methyl-D-erythritol 2,4-cyclodiphosphate synthase [Spirochaetota bacterium]